MKYKDIKTAWRTANDHGLAWTARRVIYEAKLRTGHHKRILPKRKWREDELDFWLKKGISSKDILATWRASNPKFFFSAQNQEEISTAIQQVNPNALAELQKTDIHKLTYFSKLKYQASYPNIWFTNPFLEPTVECERNKHWSAYPMYSKQYEDLKFIWESGRFAIVYDLVNAYFLTKDEKYAEQYWQIIESWIEHNPPNTGPHWKCGQETSLRLMAWYFGLFAFLDSPATTSERFERFLAAVSVQVYRVSKDYHYSYIQQSNHAVSEGLGLYVTAILFPQLEKAAEWKQMGKKILEDRALFLFRPDGTYFQKSHNYLRFIIHAYLYILRFAEANGEDFSTDLKDRMQAALDYLKAVVDEESGLVPNFGSNDGALILPINSCDFRDYRPTISALHYYFHEERYFENGAWNEDLIWLFGAEAINSKEAQKEKVLSRRFDHSGIYTLRGEDSWCFVHAESIKDRPAHADALHLDFWWKGQNILIDPGTYLYYGHAPFLDAFKHTRFHNTITVDGKDQMERAYRFTWAHWHNCKLNHYEIKDNLKFIEMEHDGYCRLDDPVLHRRAIVCVEEKYWIIIDDVLGKTSHKVQLNWLISDFPYFYDDGKIILNTPKGDFELKVFGDPKYKETINLVDKNVEGSTAALTSNYYGHTDSAIQLSISQNQKLPLRFITCFGEKGWHLDISDNGQKLKLETPSRTIDVPLHTVGTHRVFKEYVK